MSESDNQTRSQFENTPAGDQMRWTLEMQAADENQKEWIERGEKAVKEFLGDAGGRARLNLFHSDTVTKAAQLYGNPPQVKVRRRFSDPNDDVARVSAEILERLLSADIQRDGDGFQQALAHAMMDWLLPGLGQIRFRYTFDTEQDEGKEAQTEESDCTCGGSVVDCQDCGGSGKVSREIAPAVPPQDVKANEDVETDYVYWRDFRWSPCRTPDELRWIAYRVEMTKESAVERFGQDVGSKLPLKSRDGKSENDGVKDAWARVELWEIWSREDETVYWHAPGALEILDRMEDPLDLPGFFPSPVPIVANATTTKLIPLPPYELVKDLYEEAHSLTLRIRELVKAIKIVGAYSNANQALKDVLNDAVENQLIGVDDIAALLGKDGVSGSIWFMPIAPQVEAVVHLIEQRNLVKQSIYEITGMSDIMRGQATAKATATEQRIKARFGGTRLVADQQALARFASEAQRIRAQIICKMFDDKTIADRSNMLNTADKDMVPQAIALLRSDLSQYRIEVDSDQLSMTDFDALQQEGMAVMQATGEMFKTFAPVLPDPIVGPMVLEMFKVMLAGFRGSERFEAIIDKAVDQLEQKAMQPPPPPKPDPKVQAEGVKLQAVQVKAQAETVKAQADIQKTQMEMQGERAKFEMEMQTMAAEAANDKQKTGLKMLEAAAKPKPVTSLSDPGGP